MNRVLLRCYSKSVPVLENLDPLQEASLEERCITVNEKDHAIGNATKRECHQVGKNGQLILHRAFSVFIFNSKGDLLLQRRSPQKITFPDCYTNACCSHPLYDLEAEREERGASGVRKAAQRRLQHELGIPPQEATPESFHYLTRIHYQAGNRGQWGEHEIDYIMILHRDVTLNPNMNECKSCDAEYIGLTTGSLRQRMNNHRFDTNHKDPDKPVPIHAGTHNQDFQTCYTTKILRAFPKQCNSSQLRQWELAHQWITKSRLPPGLNRR
uniref:isopentenyl-diphosphate Delta-isomerase n=1 Tax=Timema californicum TaxID=61474 RepID=A0A7R9IYB2_TIMCA|nr:unnamed protein product [Timema californicum]